MSKVYNWPPLRGGKLSLQLELKSLPFAVEKLQRIPLLSKYFFCDDESDLSDLLRPVYADISEDSAFDDVASELLRSSRKKGGLVSLPVRHYAKTVPCVVFLHGFGGNGLWNIATLRQMLPQALILAPTLGVGFEGRCNPPDIEAWLGTAMASVKRQNPSFEIKGNHIVALSQGTAYAVELLNYSDYPFKSLICISGHPGRSIRQERADSLQVAIMSGAKDARCDASTCKQVRAELATNSFTASCKIVPNADHFLFLSHQDQVTKFLDATIKSTG